MAQAQALAAELARLRMLVQAAVLELAQEQTQRLVQVPELELARAAAPEPRQARELRVSRQQELQQHHLPAAAQELPPYRPVLPMKAPC